MSEITVSGSNLGTALEQILMSDEVQPGEEASYQICKLIFLYHPLGAKMAEGPIKKAQSQKREISIVDSPEDMVKEAYENEWKALDCDGLIFQFASLSRIYGASTVVYGAEDTPDNELINPFDLYKKKLYFNVLDPLNTAGSLVLNQDPTAPDFQKPTTITSNGKTFHPSRSCILFNEKPMYIAYTSSAFGYVGRSVYQRALFPLKSFVQSMITDDMVTKKAGLLIAKMKMVGSIMDKMMSAMQGIKRNLLKEARTGNVLSIDTEEAIETLNMQNTDTAMTTARKNILENVAVAADMPAKLLNSETFAEGFGEGTEDAKQVAEYIETIRNNLQKAYDYFDNIVQYRAWNPDFYATVQTKFPEYAGITYNEAFYRWKNCFKATWPSLLIEPDSEKAKTEDTRAKSITTLYQALAPDLDPANKAILIQWCADNYNEQKTIFQNPLNFDYDALKNYTPPPPPVASGGDFGFGA